MSNFVKIDTGILNSTLWVDLHARVVFLTALLMAEPWETIEPLPQLEVRTLNETGWTVPPGWYGFVPAAGVGIITRAGIDLDEGLQALERLGSTDIESRSKDFGGRRLVRVDGGYVALNFDKYRQRDYTTADRSRRYRERLRMKRSVTRDGVDVTRDITQAEAEAEAESSVAHAVRRSSRAHEGEGDDLIGEAPPGTGTTVGVGAFAPADLPARLRTTWSQIATDHGPEVATRARDAAKRLFGVPSPDQMLQTFSAAYQRQALELPADQWPDFRQGMRADRAGLQGAPTGPIDPERAAARKAFEERRAKENNHVAR